jgi:(R)-2-hydroxyacyl-CoA dehydratese activating ATPase
MLVAGLDIGSRTVKIVEWNGREVTRQVVMPSDGRPLIKARELIAGGRYDSLVATGYGRRLAEEHKLASEVITEIKAYAIGAHHLYPDVGTVLDIGGQDSKVILVGRGGSVLDFEMNDRCAAGTGRFLENMAQALGLNIDELGKHALAAEGKVVTISSMCTVFAESEVISLIGQGEDSRRVALGIHQAIVSRVSAMVRRVGLRPRFVFAGGVAYNPCMKQLLTKELGLEPSVPANPQTAGALGAAIYAASRIK